MDIFCQSTWLRHHMIYYRNPRLPNPHDTHLSRGTYFIETLLPFFAETSHLWSSVHNIKDILRVSNLTLQAPQTSGSLAALHSMHFKALLSFLSQNSTKIAVNDSKCTICQLASPPSRWMMWQLHIKEALCLSQGSLAPVQKPQGVEGKKANRFLSRAVHMNIRYTMSCCTIIKY